MRRGGEETRVCVFSATTELERNAETCTLLVLLILRGVILPMF